MQSSRTIFWIIVIIIISELGAYILHSNYKNILPAPKPIHQSLINGNCGLAVTSIVPNSLVSFPLAISGSIDNSNSNALGCSWQMFEGQAGNAQLFYLSGNTWLPLGAPAPVMVADWTAVKTTFSVSLDFDNTMGLPSGTPFKVTFTEENPSGMPPRDTYDLPIILK